MTKTTPPSGPKSSNNGIARAPGLEDHGDRLRRVATLETEPTPPSSTPVTASPKSRVLVVDDEAEIGDTIAEFLQSGGFEVSTRRDVPGALALLAAERFDLVITDIYLDDNHLGHEVARAAAQCKPPMPVIALTGKPSMDSALEALRSHVYDYVTKPVRLDTLLALARRAIKEAQLLADNAMLHQVNDLLAKILPNAIEAKDPTTRGHSDRVVHYADRMARMCGVGEHDRASLRLAALLHDVGKIGVPGSLLTKEGPLTADERKRIQEHPEIGWRILEPLEAPSQAQVREWVYQHHERWDGRGYPRQLRGEDVALPGRILIVAEVYDALATARSYKQPWPAQKIAEFFDQEAGKHFDPDLAKRMAEGLRRQGTGFLGREPGSLF
jgi:putative two-component system response regulator